MKKEHMEVILEDINSKFDLIIEGHKLLDKKIDDKTEELGKKIINVDEKVEFFYRSLDKKIDGVEEKLTRKIDGVEKRLSNEIKEVKAEVQGIGGRLDDHEERIIKLERRA